MASTVLDHLLHYKCFFVAELTQLCSKEAETTSHFLLYCPALAKVRRPYIHQVMSTCCHSNITVEPDCIIRMILDSSNLLPKDTKHEENVQNFIFKLHSRRVLLLGGDSGYKLAI